LDTETEIEPEMENSGAAEGNPLEVVMRKMEEMELRIKQREEESEALQRELQAERRKAENRSYIQTWENDVTADTQDPMAHVKAMLEQPKLRDETQDYLEELDRLVSEG
ncbi:hypothetical protein, partial [Klebsiella aerogenes]|uniref:hypothetical protein n=1 Tax=Klebsiella aerogenes TaxID=548 RepID=UPI001CC5FE7A